VMILSPSARVILVDHGGPAAVAGVRPLDLVLAVDGSPTGPTKIGGQVARHKVIALTVLRPSDESLSDVAAAEGLREWTEWERAVLAVIDGDIDSLFASLHELSLVTGRRLTEQEVAASRRITEQEAASINARHAARLSQPVQAGQRLDDVAEDCEQDVILTILGTLFEQMQSMKAARAARGGAVARGGGGRKGGDGGGRAGVGGRAGGGGRGRGSGCTGSLAAGRAEAKGASHSLATKGDASRATPLRPAMLQRWSGGSADSSTSASNAPSREQSRNASRANSRTSSRETSRSPSPTMADSVSEVES
jgi:hypothetical protein